MGLVRNAPGERNALLNLGCLIAILLEEAQIVHGIVYNLSFAGRPVTQSAKTICGLFYQPPGKPVRFNAAGDHFP